MRKGIGTEFLMLTEPNNFVQYREKPLTHQSVLHTKQSVTHEPIATKTQVAFSAAVESTLQPGLPALGAFYAGSVQSPGQGSFLQSQHGYSGILGKFVHFVG